VGRGGFEPPKA